MGRRHTGTLPVPRLHAKTGHARVYINGKEYWLGKFGSPEAQLKYDELVASYLASGRKSVKPPPESPPSSPSPATPAATPPAADITVGEVSLRWLRHVEATRGSKSSTYTAGLAAARALRDVRALPAREFGPRRLIEVRMAFASTPVVHRNRKGKVTSTKPRTRRYVNDTIGRIVQMFSWAATMEIVPGDKPAALREVKPLRSGELSTIAETPRRKAVDDARVEAVLKHLRPPLRALVRFCRLTGCRPGEAAALRLADVYDRDCTVWRYVPPQHKNAWRGHSRDIAIGPQAQAVVLEAIGARGDEATVFDPRLAVPDRQGDHATIPMKPRRASHRVGERYATSSIRHGIMRACEAAGCPAWFPYMLRYARSGEVRKKHGREAAAATLGDRTAAMADHYAPPGWEAAAEAALRSG